MRALQLTKFYPPVRGGIESVSYELVTGLNARGIATDVLCAHTEAHTLRETGPAGENIVRAASFGRVLSTSMAPMLIRELQRVHSRYDVIHVQLPDPMSNLALWFTRPGAKLVLHWQSDVVNQKRALKFYEPLQRWMLERADAVVASSEAYARASPWLAPYAAKLHAIPLGIQDPGNAPDADVQRLRAQYPGRRLVFALGRMTYYKGFDVLIDAAAQLDADTMVLVGGGGELLETYRAEVRRLGLENRIAFLGPVTESKALALFQSCHVFCLPSIVRAEAFGVVLVEAMAASRPVVTTDIPGSGVPWVNVDGETGYNVPVRDPSALAAALRRLLADDALRKRMGKAARARYLTHFTADRMVDATAELYGRLLESR